MTEMAISSTTPTGWWDENTENYADLATYHIVHNRRWNIMGVIPPWKHFSSAQAIG